MPKINAPPNFNASCNARAFITHANTTGIVMNDVGLKLNKNPVTSAEPTPLNRPAA